VLLLVALGLGNPNQRVFRHFKGIAEGFFQDFTAENMLITHRPVEHGGILQLADSFNILGHVTINIKHFGNYDGIAPTEQVVEGPYAHLFADNPTRQCSRAFSQARVANLISEDVSRCPTHVRELQCMHPKISVHDFLVAQLRPVVSYSAIPSPVTEFGTKWNEFSNNPSAFSINKGIGTGFTSLCSISCLNNGVLEVCGLSPHAKSLTSNDSKRAPCDQDSPDRDQYQRPIRYDRREELFAPSRLLRFAIGTVLFFVGAWPRERSITFRSRFGNLCWSVFSVILIGVGLVCLFWDRLVEADREQSDNEPCSQSLNIASSPACVTVKFGVAW
jgi:hypothetical protein